MASKRVSKKASTLDPILKLFLTILEAPGGGRSVKMASKIASKTALALKLGLSTPGSPPGAHFEPPRASILEPPGADFRGLGRFIASLAGSTFAAKRLANKWWSAVLAEP